MALSGDGYFFLYFKSKYFLIKLPVLRKLKQNFFFFNFQKLLYNIKTFKNSVKLPSFSYLKRIKVYDIFRGKLQNNLNFTTNNAIDMHDEI